jgi:hypothetical protein
MIAAFLDGFFLGVLAGVLICLYMVRFETHIRRTSGEEEADG